MIQKAISLLMVAVLSVVMTGCARTIDSNVYSAASIGEASFTYQGTIINARKVRVDASETLEGNSTGIGMGALGGAALGSTMGSGNGTAGAMVGLGLLGAVAGAFAEKKLKSQEGVEYTVKLTNGQLMTSVQGLETAFAVGQHVLLMVSHDGRSRIVADSSPVQEAQAPMHAPQVKVNKIR
jgi:outer membrane lipoprotein SlyB